MASTTNIKIPQTPHYTLLCLIIASKDAEYPKFEEQLRKYIEKIRDRLSIQFFFLHCSNENTIDMETHTITYNGNESLIPGIFNKTIHAMMETIHFDYEYLLRTNLSSFFDFTKILAYLEVQPIKKYIGTFLEISNEQVEMTVKGGMTIKMPIIFLNGAAFLMSKDVVFNTISKYTCMTSDELSYMITLPDDVAISILVASFYDWRNMRVLQRLEPVAKLNLCDIPRDIFHVRLKTAHIYGSRKMDIENMGRLISQLEL
jgi:hypothetical protein